MESETPQLVGIVGGSCAGKTWLADRLEQRIEGAARISLDDFYRDRRHLSMARRARINFDHPRAIDWPLVHEVLTSIASGRSAEVPQYDFTVHGRRSQPVRLSPPRVVLMEGLWLFRTAALRKHFPIKVFVRGSTGLCQERRVARDVRERGRTMEQAMEQFAKQTVPMYDRHVAGQERWADVVLDAPIAERQVMELAEKIQGSFKSCTLGI